jgi:hypothetical protein
VLDYTPVPVLNYSPLLVQHYDPIPGMNLPGAQPMITGQIEYMGAEVAVMQGIADRALFEAFALR